MWVPLGSKMFIPWQHPAQVSSCYRMSVHTLVRNVSLVRAKAHFAESSFNMSIDSKGFLNVLIYDGFFFHHNQTYKKQRINDDKAKDIQFCADKNQFVLNVNGESAFNIEGNFSFFLNLNSWTFIDKSRIFLNFFSHKKILDFTGCVSRLQIGSTFPLKNPSDSRLNYKGRIKFGSCPYDRSI